MKFTASAIAKLLDGHIAVGNKDIEVSSFAKIEEAGVGQITFLANAKYEPYLYSTKASIVIINNSFEPAEQVNATLIKVKDAYTAVAYLLSFYDTQKREQLTGVEEDTIIHKTAQLAPDVYVGGFTYIAKGVIIGEKSKIFPQVYIGENVVIGSNTCIMPGVKIYDNTIIGNHVIIHGGTVIGSDGFGFVPQSDGSYTKIPQIGNVVIEDYVEIGANVCIDRATMGSTIIKKGTKLDNLIQIAHNVEIGENTVIAAQAGISGSTKVGKNVRIAGQVGIVGHLSIADNTTIAAQSGITKSITEVNTTLMGAPASNHYEALRSQAALRQLPDLLKKIREMEKKIESLLIL
ncbi:MAG: UDP-3-O-(3-hydroxymyristoyl)glucosamine N-acyltransferase [Phycisphaerales bacterium]|nr:UDP-3-O-(3-hydroxymyristoyl)glucosamine N-acyltransferase [Phycisphaerales bacterium]